MEPQISNISRRLLFDVFARDHFECCLCHAHAPNVPLTVKLDKPLEEGGDLLATNLKTICQECYNREKGLPVPKPIAQYAIRHEQMRLILHWKKEAATFFNDNTELIADYFAGALGLPRLGAMQRIPIKKALRHASVEDVIDIMDEALLNTIRYDKATEAPTESSIDKFYDTFPRYLYVASHPEPQRSMYIVRGRLRRLAFFNDKKALAALNEMATRLKDVGMDTDEVSAELRGQIAFLSSASVDYNDWKRQADAYITSIEMKYDMEPRYAGKLAENVTAEDLRTMTKEQIMDYIRYMLRDPDATDYHTQHRRIDMSGFNPEGTTNTQYNMDIINVFAHLGIYDYVDFLTLNCWKGWNGLYYRYSDMPENYNYFGNARNLMACVEEDLSGYGTVEIIYRILEVTILSRRKIFHRD